MLVVAEPQPLLTVLEELRSCPTVVVRPDEPGAGERWGVSHESQDLPGAPLAREHPMPLAQLTHLQPAGSDETIADHSLGLGEHTGVRAAPPTQLLAVA